MTEKPQEADAHGLEIGSVLDGRYRIDALLGSGGMGAVYRGEHLGIGRAVAIKVLHTEIGSNREATQRFQREALASGRLDHPNIVTVSDFGVLDDGSCYLIMEALDGVPLGARLDAEGAIAWSEAVEIIRGVLLGLAHAHARGVVHRDIKPDNIFLARKDGEDVVKLLDFGIAKLFAGTDDGAPVTRAGMTMGTPAYLSPEQAVGGTITPASDVYSASVVLFEMLTGHVPFEGPDLVSVMMAHVSRPPPAMHDVAPSIELPPGLEDLVRRGLEKLAEERIASASVYVTQLDAIIRATDEPGRTDPPIADDLVRASVTRLGSLLPRSFRSLFRAARGLRGPKIDPWSSVTIPSVSSEPATASPTWTHPAAIGLTGDVAQVPRPVSITDASTPLPKRWIAIAGMLLAGMVLVAIILAIVTGGNAERPVPPTASGPPLALSVPLPSLIDPDVALKALLHDLQQGKTCPERRAVIPKLVELGDQRAIPPLRAARYRMRGGVLGFGQSNTNGCLKADADRAIKALGGAVK